MTSEDKGLAVNVHICESQAVYDALTKSDNDLYFVKKTTTTERTVTAITGTTGADLITAITGLSAGDELSAQAIEGTAVNLYGVRLIVVSVSGGTVILSGPASYWYNSGYEPMLRMTVTSSGITILGTWNDTYTIASTDTITLTNVSSIQYT